MKRNFIMAFMLVVLGVGMIVPLLGASSTENANNAVGYNVEINGNYPGIRDTQVSPGEKIKLSLTLRPNTDINALDITARVTGNDGRQILTEVTETVSNLNALTQSTERLFLVLPETTEPGRYSLELELDERNGYYRSEQSYRLQVGGSDNNLRVRDVIVEPTVESDRTFYVTARVSNLGEYVEENIRVTAEVTEFNIQGETYINTLEVGETTTTEQITLKLPCSTIAGEYRVTVTANYNYEQETATSEETFVVEGSICGRIVEPENRNAGNLYEANLVSGDSPGRYNVVLTNNDEERRVLIVETTENVENYVRYLPSNIAMVQPGNTETVAVDVSNIDELGETVVFKIYVRDLEGNTVAEFREYVDEERNSKANLDSLRHVLETGLIILILILLVAAVFMLFRRHGDSE